MTHSRAGSHLAVIVVVVAAALATAAVSAAESAASRQALTFAWPAPAKVAVTQDAVKKGKRARMRFNLVTEMDPRDGSLLVGFRDYEFLEFDGMPVDTAEAREALAPVLALTSLVPSFRVAADGALVELVGLDVEAMVQGLRRMGKADPQVEAVFDRLTKSPEMRAQIEAKAADSWSLWVGFWREQDLEEGGTRTVITRVPVLGAELDQQVVVRHLGRAEGCPGCVRLRAEATLEGPDFRKAWMGMTRSLAGQGDHAKGLEEFLASVEDIKRTSIMETVTDPATLKPVTVTSETRVTVRARNQPPAEQTERATYAFAWPAPGK